MQTIRELTVNPPGKGSGHVAARYSIIKGLDDRFKALLSEGKRFRSAVYQDGKKTVFLIQVPSETLPKGKFWWDVVFEVESGEAVTKTGLLDSPVKVYSDNPAFVYTGYAFVANRDGFLIEWLAVRLPKEAKTTKPDVRNPGAQMGFDKSVYFAARYILESGMYAVPVEKRPELSRKTILAAVEPYDSVMAKYANAKKREVAAKKKEREKERLEKESEKRKVKKTTGSAVRTAKKVKKVKKAGRS
jgi:hypothetical protein